MRTVVERNDLDQLGQVVALQCSERERQYMTTVSDVLCCHA